MWNLPRAKKSNSVFIKIETARRFSRGTGAALILLILLGCATQSPTNRQCAPPCPESRGAVNDGPPSAYKYTDPIVFEKLMSNVLKAGEPAPGRKKMQILAVSGGGKYGAYPAGAVCGWTARGDRPTFDIVTGVSTGAYVAVFAFLGPKYDETLKKFYTEVTTDQILKKKPYLTLPWASSFASSEPLKNLIESTITAEVVTDLAAAHTEGRRLFIGTTNLDTKRLCVWDVTAIAASDRPDKKTLLRDIFLATASVPGEFPPVEFNITVNGTKYTELHVDGGVTSEVFVRLALLNVSTEQLESGPRPLEGSTVHILLAGKLFADPACTKPKLIGILGSSVSSLIYGMTQNDILRIGYLCLLTGMEYRFAAIPREFEDDGDALNFEPISMGKLFEAGFELGRTGTGWRSRSPGTLAEEQSVPRTGTNFTIPNLPAPGAYGGPVLPKK